MRRVRTPVEVRRTLIYAVAWVIALPCAALGQAGARCPKLQGPYIVHPKGLVVFKQHGFKPGAPVQVTVGPLQIGDASARLMIIHKAFRIGADGRMKLRFRWPAHGTVCFGTGECHPIPWTSGERAYVNADVGSDPAAPSGCAYKHVTIRRAR